MIEREIGGIVGNAVYSIWLEGYVAGVNTGKIPNHDDLRRAFGEWLREAGIFEIEPRLMEIG